MSFFDKARQAAEQTRHAASQGIAQATSPESKAHMQQSANQLRDAASKAGKGMVSAVSKIDPAILADIVIRATAIQEKANRSLKNKRSAYRIAEITITATIPPQIGFSIARVGDTDDEDEELLAIDSQELVETVATGEEEEVSLERGDAEEPISLEGE